MRIGVLAVQGAFAEHISKLQKYGADAFEIRHKSDISEPLDGLVLPGGESTVMRKLLHELDLFEPLKTRIESGLPVLATCAGMILLAQKVVGGAPAYYQIYKAIREKIANGSFVRGDKLPSKRLLARDCGVSISTVEHAYAMLCEEGFCETKQRSGCYVIYDPDNSFPIAANISETAAGTAENELSKSGDLPFSPFAAAYRRVILNYGERILTRSPNKGCIELRMAISRYLSRCRNIEVSAENIVIGSGAEYLYGMCVQMLGRDTVIALEDPSYEKIKAVYTANGATCEMLKMDGEGIRTDELVRSRASALHVTPFNSFPSGITASEARRREYLKWAKERGAVIIEDDYDSEFSLTVSAPGTLFGMTESGNVIYINTFTNTIAPSLRAGYMLLPDALMPRYSEKIGFYSCTVPMLEQYFLAEWINSSDFERNIGRLRKNRDL